MKKIGTIVILAGGIMLAHYSRAQAIGACGSNDATPVCKDLHTISTSGGVDHHPGTTGSQGERN
jgi:hypothetical protein